MTAFDKALAEIKDVKKIIDILTQRMTFGEFHIEATPCGIEGCDCPHGLYKTDSGTTYECDAGWVIRSKMETIKSLKVIYENDKPKDTFIDKEVKVEYAYACPRCRPRLNAIQKEQHYDFQAALWQRNKMINTSAESRKRDHL